MKEQINWALNNIASVSVLAVVNVLDIIPPVVGVVGGLAVAWYNIEKAISVRKERNKK
jgi:hypothetical protein